MKNPTKMAIIIPPNGSMMEELIKSKISKNPLPKNVTKCLRVSMLEISAKSPIMYVTKPSRNRDF